MASKGPRVVSYNGTQHSFPGDATDDEISQALETSDQQSSLKAKMAQPTEFELDRNYGHDRPGVGASLWDTVKSFFKPQGFAPYPGVGVDQKVQAFNDAKLQDKLRQDRGYGPGYRMAAAALPMVDTPGMEEEAAHGNEAGVWGHAAGSALPYVAPMVAEGGLRGGGAVLEHPLTAKVIPSATRVLGGGLGYELGKHVGHPVMGAGAGYELGRDLGPVLADAATATGRGMSSAGKWAGEFMQPPPPAKGERIPLWKQVQVEAGHPPSSIREVPVSPMQPRQGPAYEPVTDRERPIALQVARARQAAMAAKGEAQAHFGVDQSVLPPSPPFGPDDFLKGLRVDPRILPKPRRQ